MRTIKLTNSDDLVKIDDEDYPVLSRLNWYLSDGGYAITDCPVKHIKMHKLIIGPIPNCAVIDHIDRDKLNNQKSNLRVVSQSDNVRNSDRCDNCQHFYYDTRRGKWTIDSRTLGIRYMVVESPEVARRTISKLMLGFPKDVALTEARKPTISTTNWKQFNITYADYINAQRLGISIKNYRRRLSRKTKLKN